MNLFNNILISLSIVFITACGTDTNTKQSTNLQSENTPIRIGISKAQGSTGYLRYGKWLKKLDSSIVYFDLYHTTLDSALIILRTCDGLLLSGGPDVNPARYNQIEDTILCETIDYNRDSLEYALIDLALQKGMPILGICRGEQILNVYMGGSLYPDIPTAKPNNVGHRFTHIDSSLHAIAAKPNSLLTEITKSDSGIVNSSHHQCVDRLADNLVILAQTQDSIPEAISWKNPKDKSFLLGVQWHPEWLEMDNPFSYNIGIRFLEETQNYQLNK
jgi:putative glutamine amidotransferase